MTELDRYLISQVSSTDPPGRIDVWATITHLDKRFYVAIRKTLYDFDRRDPSRVTGGRPPPGRSYLDLFEVERELVLVRMDLRSIIYAATADPDLAP